MPKLPAEARWPLCALMGEKAKEEFVGAGEFGTEWFSNSWFAGDDMMDRDVIKEEMTSGDAGCRCTRLLAGVEGPWRERRRVCLDRPGIGGGVVESMISCD